MHIARFVMAATITLSAVAFGHGAEAQVVPPPPAVPVVDNCVLSRGDVAWADPMRGAIFTCSPKLAMVEASFPGFTTFTLMHERAHFIVGGNERAADCLAAQWLGPSAPPANAAAYFATQGPLVINPLYGSGLERAARIRACAGM